MVQWQQIGSPSETKVGRRTVSEIQWRFPNGREFPFYTIGRQGDEAAAIFALTPENELVISEQFRPGPGQSMAELPGGFSDLGEDPETVAKRELLEETGYQPARMVYLGHAYKEAYHHLKVHYFIGYDCRKVAEPQPESTEYIEVKKMSVGQFLEVARGGGTTELGALFLAYDTLKKIQEEEER